MDWGYTTTGIFFFVLAILSLYGVSWYLFRESPSFHQNEHYHRIPKKIWTYQDSETPTRLQSQCYESWRIQQPTYDIIILTPQTYKGYVQISERSSVPLWRDKERWEEALCLYTLAEHGGMWLDSRTRLNGPVTHWQFPKFGECSLFYWKDHTRNRLQPFVDRRCIAANRDSLFIQKWKEEIERLLGHPSVEAYLRSIYTSTPLNTFTFPAEWLSSFSLQHALLQHPYPMESIILHSVEDGPMKHYQEGRGDKKKAIDIGLHSTHPIVFLEEL